ncbi:hypothetical protein PACTADRAFT_35569 [Pachysolen tannophilus NRRL Y-2460]|uniref:DNA-directed RNA polymerase III subunit RPC4 n=1 Tax=Pachysolen tannophilus NRRL Y-2460 TaxID=669874 RepID=A0A1E4TQ64_PACTA|nr:hypothetical protein PACTADRAFT_35569 [Pachysolen tannophilus NRRL Y-2460]
MSTPTRRLDSLKTKKSGASPSSSTPPAASSSSSSSQVAQSAVPKSGSNAGPSSKPKTSLKFKPKAVARRSKEVRDAEAPLVIEKSEQDLPIRGGRGSSSRGGGEGGSGGRGNGGGGRGGGRLRDRGGYLGNTHMVTAGPLSSGVVSIDDKKLNRFSSGKSAALSSAFSPSPTPASATPDFLKNLRTKHELDRKSRSSSVDVGSRTMSEDEEESEFVVDDNAMTKINMNKEYILDESQTEFFPVRSQRDENLTNEYDSVILNQHDIQEGNSLVKNETTNETKILHGSNGEKDYITPDLKNDAMGSYQLGEEKSRLANDHRKIAELIKNNKDADGDLDMSGNDDNQEFLFFQLPKLLPDFKKVNGDDVEEGNDQNLSGKIGNLRFHKSGKLTIKLGNIVFDVTRGGSSNFLQDIVQIEYKKKEQDDNNTMENDADQEDHQETQIYHLGHLFENLVVTPTVNQNY